MWKTGKENCWHQTWRRKRVRLSRKESSFRTHSCDTVVNFLIPTQQDKEEKSEEYHSKLSIETPWPNKHRGHTWRATRTSDARVHCRADPVGHQNTTGTVLQTLKCSGTWRREENWCRGLRSAPKLASLSRELIKVTHKRRDLTQPTNYGPLCAMQSLYKWWVWSRWPGGFRKTPERQTTRTRASEIRAFGLLPSTFRHAVIFDAMLVKITNPNINLPR